MICWQHRLSADPRKLDLHAGGLAPNLPLLARQSMKLPLLSFAEDEPPSKAARTGDEGPLPPLVQQLVSPPQPPYGHFNGVLPVMCAPPQALIQTLTDLLTLLLRLAAMV